MYTNKQRAELANICYMTIEKECDKPLNEINADLVDAGIDLANKLLDIKPLSEEELLSAKKKIEAMGLRHRKRLKIRIIAAVLAALILLGTTVYAFSEWIFGVFGNENLHGVEPGYTATVEDHELEAPSDILYFDSIEELVAYVDEPICLPSSLTNQYELKTAALYKFKNICVDMTFMNASDTVVYMVNINPDYYSANSSNLFENEYYSPSGIPFKLTKVGAQFQATCWMDKNEYIILTDYEETLKSIIDEMTYIE